MTLEYDAENRLVSAGSVSYTYDLLGRRISRTDSGSTTTYVWDGAHIIAEYSGTGSLIRKYIYGPGMDNPVVMINVDAYGAETWYYYYADALGSIRLMTNASGYPVESYTYDVYGQPRVMTAAGGDNNWLTEDVQTTYNSSSIDNPYMFSGRRWDSTTGLYYYRFRDYSAELGRFCQTDPAGYIDTMNLYAYCGNNPVNWIDPWGLWGDHNQFRRPGSQFDYNHLDSGWTHPFNPFATWRHFRSREDIASDLRQAIQDQDQRAFEEHMHEWQDSYSHYDQGYRWWSGGHVPASIFGATPDDPTVHQQEFNEARRTTREWEDLYNRNPNINDLANQGENWAGRCPLN